MSSRIPTPRTESIPDLAVAVAARHKPFDRNADLRLGEMCFNVTQTTDHASYIRERAGDYGVGQEYVLEAQWMLVSEFGAQWKAGRL